MAARRDVLILWSSSTIYMCSLDFLAPINTNQQLLQRKMFPENSFRDKIPTFPSRSQTSSQLTVPSYQLTNQELFQLVHHHDKFILMVNQLITISQRKIDENQASDAIPYLSEAQKILQYAASCGKNIDRKLIMGVLHNQAYAYQRMWELQKCSNYLEALIFNINERMASSSEQRSFIISKPHQVPDSTYNYHNESSNYLRDNRCGIPQDPQHPSSTSKLNLNEKINLIKYYLQFSAVNSQLKNHSKSVQSGNRALKHLKELFVFVQKYSKINFELNYPLHINSSNFSFAKLMIENLLAIDDAPNLDLYQSYVKVCRSLYSHWEKRTQNSLYPVNEELKKLTIGSVMQIKSFSKESMETEQAKLKNSDYLIESSQQNLTFDRLIYFIILMCISYFTLSTELRLQSFSTIKLNYKGNINKLKTQYERSQPSIQAEIYHLIGLSVYFIYVPFRLNFLQHVINSYMNHYSGEIRPKQLSGKYESIPGTEVGSNLPKNSSKSLEEDVDNEEEDIDFKRVLDSLDPLNISDWIYENKCPSYLDSKCRSLKTSEARSKKKSSKSSKKNMKKKQKTSPSVLYPSLQILSKIQAESSQQNKNVSTVNKQLSNIQKRYKKVIAQKYNDRDSSQPQLDVLKKKRSLNGSTRKIANSMSKLGKSAGQISHSKKLDKSRKNKGKESKTKHMSATYDYKILGCLDRDDQEEEERYHYYGNEHDRHHQAHKRSNKKKQVKPKSKQSSSKSGQKKTVMRPRKVQRRVQRQEKEAQLFSARMHYQLDCQSRGKLDSKKSKQLTPKKMGKVYKRPK